MKQIYDIHFLSPGYKIISINNGSTEILEFLCIHPHNDKYSLFLNHLKDGTPKFYNERLRNEDWYLFEDTKNMRNNIKNLRRRWLLEELKRLDS